jgi:uncharacterized protein
VTPGEERAPDRRGPGRRWGLILLACAAFVLVGGRVWGSLVGERAWYGALDAETIWRWQVKVSLALKLLAGSVGTLAMRMHLAGIRRSFVSVVVPSRLSNLRFQGELPESALSALLWTVSLLVGCVLTLLADDWIPLARAIAARATGESEPYLGLDLSSWVDRLPFEVQSYHWILAAHACMCLLVVSGYIITGGIATRDRGLHISRHARRHLTVLGAIMLLLLAWSFRLDAFDRLIFGGQNLGFSFSDHRVGLPASAIMQVVCIMAAAAVLYSAWSRAPRAGLVAVTTVLLLGLALRQGERVLADAIAGDERPAGARDEPYRATQDAYSRRAYAADSLLIALDADTASVQRTPLWDEPVLPREAGAPRAVRQLRLARRSDGSTLAASWSTSAAGLLPVSATPVRLGDSRPWADGARMSVAPLVVADSVPGYAVVSDPNDFFAAPGLRSPLARLAHAWNEQNPQLLFGARPASAVLLRSREVSERVERLAPLWLAGTTIALMAAVDSLWWVADMYAVSDHYPLSEHRVIARREVTAAQYVATALVNAHSGRVTFYADDATLVGQGEPLGREMAIRLESAGILRSWTRLDARIRSELPPRSDALELTASVALRTLARPLVDPIPRSTRTTMRGLTLVSALPGDSQLPPVRTSDVWLSSRAAWARTGLGVDNGGGARGVVIAPGGSDRRVRWMPLSGAQTYDLLARSAGLVLDSLRSAGQGSLWVRGAARIVPSANGVNVITPLYLPRDDDRALTLAGVVVADGMHRTLAPTVALAIADWRSTPGVGRSITDGLAAGEYRALRDALRRGAWGEFGARLDVLGRLLGVPADTGRP